MNERLTWEGMKALHLNKWVFVKDIEWEGVEKIISGVVSKVYNTEAEAFAEECSRTKGFIQFIPPKKDMNCTDDRLTWDQIVERYPDKSVGLVNVEWINESNIKSAVVKYTSLSRPALLSLQMQGEIEAHPYTTPNNSLFIGVCR